MLKVATPLLRDYAKAGDADTHPGSRLELIVSPIERHRTRCRRHR